MLKKMPYSLYRSSYRAFKLVDYNKSTKTALVELPDTPPVKFPKTWSLAGNHYETPNGCRVYFWNSGLARNYEIEFPDGSRRTIPAAFDSAARVLSAVNAFSRNR